MATKAKRREISNSLARRLNRNIARLAARLEASQFAAYAELAQKPGKLLWRNFLAGLSRGVGIFLGAGAMGAIALAIASAVVYWLLKVFDMFPLIGDFTGAVRDVLSQFLSQHKK